MNWDLLSATISQEISNASIVDTIISTDTSISSSSSSSSSSSDFHYSSGQIGGMCSAVLVTMGVVMFIILISAPKVAKLWKMYVEDDNDNVF